MGSSTSATPCTRFASRGLDRPSQPRQIVHVCQGGATPVQIRQTQARQIVHSNGNVANNFAVRFLGEISRNPYQSSEAQTSSGSRQDLVRGSNKLWSGFRQTRTTSPCSSLERCLFKLRALPIGKVLNQRTNTLQKCGAVPNRARV